MQRMIMIPVEQYDRMLDSYDEVMKEVRKLRRQLVSHRYGKAEEPATEEEDCSDKD